MTWDQFVATMLALGVVVAERLIARYLPAHDAKDPPAPEGPAPAPEGASDLSP